MPTLENLDLVKAKLPDWHIPPARPYPPISNRGVKLPKISIDAVTITCKISGKLKRLQALAFLMFCEMAIGQDRGSISIPEKPGKGRGGYEHGWSCYCRGKELAGMHWGGNKGTMMFELHGAFTGRVRPELWRRVEALVRLFKGRITRIDLAADFYQGELCVRCCNDVYTAAGPDFLGIQAKGGRLPAKRFIDGGMNGSSLYIGSRSSARQIVIYEKGRQLGFFDLPWCRAEVRFRRARSGLKRYEIPLELLRPDKWWSYWAGSADYLSRLAQAATALHIGGTDIEYQGFLDYLHKQVKACHTQYGGLIGFLERTVGAAAACFLLRRSRWSGFDLYPEAAEYTSDQIKSILGPFPAFLEHT